MLQKYGFKREHEDCRAIVNFNGAEVLVTKDNLTDEIAEYMVNHGMAHLIQIYHHDIPDQKKSFIQISDTVIKLVKDPDGVPLNPGSTSISTDEKTGENNSIKIVKTRKSRSDAGKPRKPRV